MIKQLLIPFGLLAAVSSGCVLDFSKSCTLLGHIEGLTIELSADELMPAILGFTLELPDDSYSFTLDMRNTEVPGLCVHERIENQEWWIEAQLCGPTGPNEAYHGHVSVQRANGAGGPERATLTLAVEDRAVGFLDLPNIDYKDWEPNGPGCGVATTFTAALLISP